MTRICSNACVFVSIIYIIYTTFHCRKRHSRRRWRRRKNLIFEFVCSFLSVPSLAPDFCLLSCHFNKKNNSPRLELNDCTIGFSFQNPSTHAPLLRNADCNFYRKIIELTSRNNQNWNIEESFILFQANAPLSKPANKICIQNH